MPGKEQSPISYLVFFNRRFIITCLLCFFSLACFTQDVVVEDDSTAANVKDVGDVLNKLFKKKPDTTKTKKKGNVAILPSLGYNPSFGFVFGAKVSVIRQFGQAENTALSTFGIEGSYSTKGIITAQARHNVFTPGNKWNFQGNWQLSKFIITDYSIGTGNKNYLTGGDSAFPIKFHHVRFTEKIYRDIGKHFFAGGGLSFNLRYKIQDEKLDSLGSTPHYRYSLRNGYDPKKYSANAFLLGMVYNTKEHPLRSYGGLYAEAIFALSQTWLGSSKNALQLVLDLRKYISLSKKNPEHVFALWHLGSYLMSNTVPYLALPATGYDIYNRSGRGYTIGRFKGPSYSYFETEYRFPITRNKLFSGVAFMNVTTASDDLGKKLFQYWEHAVGGGLRILFQKHSRSTICIDYVRGKYGSQGWFFGLNEVF